MSEGKSFQSLLPAVPLIGSEHELISVVDFMLLRRQPAFRS